MGREDLDGYLRGTGIDAPPPEESLDDVLRQMGVDVSPPVAPPVAPEDDAAWKRTPAVHSESVDRGGMIQRGQALYQAVLDKADREELSPAEAHAKAADATRTVMVLGENADTERVRDAVDAYEAPDTLGKQATRVFGQRLIPFPEAEPSKGERDALQSKREQEYRPDLVGSIAKAWNAGDTGPTKVESENDIKPWIQRAKDVATVVGEGILSGGMIPASRAMRQAYDRAEAYINGDDYAADPALGVDLIETLSGPGILTEALNDTDVQTVAGGLGPVRLATGFVANNTPVLDFMVAADEANPLRGKLDALASALSARGIKVEPFKPGVASEIFDNVRTYEAFDAANTLYDDNDRSAVDALPLQELPALLRGDRIDVAAFRKAAQSGDEDFASLLPHLGTSDAFFQRQVELLPVAVVAKVQGGLAPTDAELEKSYLDRKAAKAWRGEDEGRAALRLLQAGLLTPVGDSTDLMVAPSRLQEALRLVGVAWSGAMEANVGATDIGWGATALPRAALYAGETVGVPGAENLREKIEAFKVPTAYGLEAMIESGAYDDVLDWAGLATSKNYAGLYDPESTWLSRTLADTANPDYASRWLLDTYERAGGEKDSGAGRTLAAADILAQFVLPVEEVALLPLLKGASAINRGRMMASVAPDLGLTRAQARKAALVTAMDGTDGVASGNAALTRAAIEGIQNGTLDPARIGPTARREIESVLRTTGMDPAQLATLWDTLADRHGRILDAAKNIEVGGGPATKALRASTPHLDRTRDLDALVRAKNLTPRERDLALMFLEASAFRWADETGEAPAEYFARHSWVRAPEADARPLPAGSLMSETPPDVEAKAPGISALRRSMLDAAGGDTAFDAKVYAERQEVCALTGHCNAAAYVVQKRYGGDLLSAKVNGETHVWNRLPDGTEIDLTGSQYGGDGFHPVAAKGKVVPARATVNPRFKAFEKRVEAAEPLYSRTDGTTHGSIERAPVKSQTETPEFQAWFGDSKVVDASGKPRPLYHGTTKDFDEFKAGGERGMRSGLHGDGLWFTDEAGETASEVGGASDYATGDGGRVIPVYVSIRNPKRMSAFHASTYSADELRKAGYDGAYIIDTDAWVALEPTQVKSSIANSGAFDPNNPSILRASTGATVHGAISPAAGDPIRTLNPDRVAWEAAGRAAADKVKASESVPNPEWARWDAERQRLESAGPAPSAQAAPSELQTLRQRRDSLQKSPRKDDPEWESDVEEVNDRIAELEASGAQVNRIPPHIIPPAVVASAPSTSLLQKHAGIGYNDAAVLLDRVRSGEITWEDALIIARRHGSLGFPADFPRPRDPEMEAMGVRAARQNNPALRAHLDAEPPEYIRSPDYDAAAADLARLRSERVPRTVTKPSDASQWLIRLFRTGDILTAFHEGTHLLDLMMGEAWTRQAMGALGFDPTGPITREVREAIAEAGTRSLRGTLRPGTKLGNVMEDLRDTVGDVWRRVRRQPGVTTPEFQKFWDATFRPNDGNVPLAARLVDDATPNADPFRTVVVSDDPVERIREGLHRRRGTAEEAGRTMRGAPEVRQALGLSDAQREIPLAELVGRAIGYVGTERMRRGWGFGKLETLTPRIAVPAARAARIKRDVNAYRTAVLGKVPPPTVINGVETFTFTPGQQAGVRRMLADVYDQPVSVYLPERLQDPAADLSTVTRDEWNALANTQAEVRAGAGAFRDRRAELVAVSGITRLFDVASETLRRPEAGTLGEDVTRMRDRFIVSMPGQEYVNPAQREVLASVVRDLGSVPARVGHWVTDRQKGGQKWQAAVTDIARSMAPEFVPVDLVEDVILLRRTQDVSGEQAIAAVTADADLIGRVFSRTDLRATEQALQEQRGLSVVSDIGTRMEAGMDFAAALSDAGVTKSAADDAMSWVQEGIRRRIASVESTGDDIMRILAGSNDDKAIAAGYEKGRYDIDRIKAYTAAYSGDWVSLLDMNQRIGLAAAQSEKFDQGRMAIGLLTRLEARRVMGDFSRRLAEVGVAGDVSAMLKRGRRGDRSPEFGSFEDANGAITAKEYTDDVQHYLNALTGWKTSREVQQTPEGLLVNDPPGMRGPRGTVNPPAYDDANRILQSWGFKVGKGVSWDYVDLPGGDRILLPQMLQEPLKEVMERAAPSGGAFTTQTKLGEVVPGSTKIPSTAQLLTEGRVLPVVARGAGRTYDFLYEMGQYAFGKFKTGLTTGIGPLFKPAFFIGNAFGGMLQLYQGVGLTDALRIISRPVMPTAEGNVIRRVLWRMWDDGAGTMKPAQRGFFDSLGRWHSDQSIAEGAVRAGLNSSLAKSEFTNAIIEDIRQNEPTKWNALMDSPGKKAAVGAVVGGALAGPGGALFGAMVGGQMSRWWQNTLTEAATAVDNYYRVSTYVDGLKRGLSDAEAAEMARRVAFDYNEVTEFEKNYLRKFIIFYSFQRKNQDLFLWTLANHPSRVLAQMRALRGMQQANLGEDSEVFVTEWNEGRFMFNWREPLVEGHNEAAGRGAVTLTPRLPIGDAIGLWQSLLTVPKVVPAAFGWGDMPADAVADLLERVNPFYSVPFGLATGVDVRSQRKIEGWNEVPNWLIEMDANLTGGMLKETFKVEQAQFRDASGAPYRGAPRWVIGPDKKTQQNWWVLNQLTTAGSSINTISAMQRADYGESMVEGGGVQAAIDASRWLGEFMGNDVGPEVADMGEPRAGLTEGEEFASYLGFKPMLVPLREEVLSRLMERRGKVVEDTTRKVGQME